MSITARVRFGGVIREVLESGIEFASNPTINHTPGRDINFDADTDPEGVKFSGEEWALVAGALTLDFTNLVGVNAAVDASGLKPRWLYIRNTGAAAITFEIGASNGSDMLAGAWEFTLRPGEDWEQSISDTGPTVVSGTNKTVDVSGTGTDTFQLAIIFG